MPAHSSPSHPPTNPRATRASPSEKHLRTPRRVMFCKRRGTFLSKLYKLCGLTGARAAVIVLSITGRLYFCGGSSVEEMEETCFDYVCRNGGAMPPMGPKEGWEWVQKRPQRTEIAKIPDRGRLLRAFSNRFKTIIKMAYELCTKTDARAAVVVFSHTGFGRLFGNDSFENIIFDWVKKQRESCVTKEDIDSLNFKYEAVLRYVREKLKDISGSGNSGVGAGCDSEVLSDDDIDSVLQSFKASRPLLFAHFKDYVRDGLLTSPVNSAVASGSSGEEPMRSVLVGCELNPHSSPNLSENNPSVNAGAGGHSGVGVGHADESLYDDDDDWIYSLPYTFEVTCPSLVADLGNLAVTGGSLGVESTSTLSDLEGSEFVDSLLDLSGDLFRDGYFIPPENSTVHGGSSGEGQGSGYDPDIFSTLQDLNVSLEI